MKKPICFILFLIFGIMPYVMANGQAIEYEFQEKAYEGYLLKNEKATKLIFMIHDWDGITDYEIKRAEMLGKEGYSVFAVDMFGKGVRPTEVKDKKALTGALYANREQMRALMTKGLEVAKEQGLPVDHVISLGYCFGGTCVLEAARAGMPFLGHASFHGGLATPEGQTYEKTKGEIFVFHGSADDYVPLEDFIQLTKAMEAHKIKHEMITYSGALHAFSVFGSDRYQKEADEKSWARFLSLVRDL